MEVNQGEALELLLGEVVGEYFDRLGRGERPDVEEYARRHPELAEQLRTALPALCLVAEEPVEPAVSDRAPAHDSPGSRLLGDFRIIRELGRGGMGVVYEAEQCSLGRRVALKVLPFAAMVESKALERFRNEVRAAATLSHNHIVPVYSVGEERGVHYYAMQLIRGASLADLIAQLKRHESGEPSPEPSQVSRQLLAQGPKDAGPDSAPTEAYQHSDHAADETPRASGGQKSTLGEARRTAEYFASVARLAIQAADGLQHAHDRGIIHRDIKPGNLLLDGEGHLYLTDFGLARIESAAGVTMTGDLVGTLRYMSPEQALAQRVVIDHRADLYSLGATLYELLTLQPAFAETDRKELLKQIAFHEPRAPRKLDARIPVDLETIVLKALAKDPGERYPSAEALADDLRAFLEQRPIAARPLGLWGRGRKWSRRNPGTVAAAVVLLLLTTIGLTLSNWLVARERDAARRARDAESQQRGVADAKRRDAERELARAVAAERLAEERLAEVQRQTDVATTNAQIAKAVNDFLTNDLLGRAAPHSEPNRDLKVRDVLDRAALNIADRFAEQPVVEATIRETIGTAYHALGQLDEAQHHMERAHELYRLWLGETHESTLRTALELTWIARRRGQYHHAHQRVAEVVTLCQKHLGDRSLVTHNALMQLGNLEGHLGLADQAQNTLTKVVDVTQRTFGPKHPRSLLAMEHLAAAYYQSDNYDRAVPLQVTVLDCRRDALGLTHPETLTAMHNLANTYCALAKYTDAEPLYLDCLEVRRQVLGSEHRATLLTAGELALLHMQRARYVEAAPLLLHALPIARRVYGTKDTATLTLGTLLANLYLETGDIAKADALSAECLNVAQQTFGLDHRHTVDLMLTRAKVSLRQANHAEAEEICARILSLLQGARGSVHDTLQTQILLADIYKGQGRISESERILVQCLESTQGMWGSEPRALLSATSSLAGVYAAQGKPALAESLLSRCLETAQRELGQQHPDIVTFMSFMICNYLAQAKYSEAETLGIRCLEMSRRVRGPEDDESLKAMSNLAAAYFFQEKYGEAESLLTECLSARRRLSGVEHHHTLAVLNSLAWLYYRQSRYVAAEPLYVEYLATMQCLGEPDQPESLNAMFLLAKIYVAQEKYAQAERLFTQCLDSRRCLLGEEHPDTLAVMNSLAVHYDIQSQKDKAEPLWAQCLETMRGVWGPEHADTLKVTYNLAMLHIEDGELTKALRLLMRCFEENRGVLGLEHDALGMAMRTLAMRYRRQQSYPEAEQLYVGCVEIAKRVHGPEHALAIRRQNELGTLYHEQGQFARAEAEFATCLESARRVWGPEHPDTLVILRNLATQYREQGRFEEAESQYTECLEIQRRVLGRNHAQTLETVEGLGRNYAAMGHIDEAIRSLEEAHASRRHNPQYDVGWLIGAYSKVGRRSDALRVCEEQLADRRQVLPKDSSELALELARAGAIMLRLQAFPRAETCIRESLAIREAQQPEEWTTFGTYSLLGGALFGQGKLAEAEPLLLKGYEGLTARESTIPPQGRVRLVEAVDRLVELYTSLDKPEELQKWQAERAKYQAPPLPDDARKDG